MTGDIRGITATKQQRPEYKNITNGDQNIETTITTTTTET